MAYRNHRQQATAAAYDSRSDLSSNDGHDRNPPNPRWFQGYPRTSSPSGDSSGGGGGGASRPKVPSAEHHFRALQETQVMALATQGELVSMVGRVVRMEHQLEAEKELRLRLENEFRAHVADTRKMESAMKDEIESLTALVNQLLQGNNGRPSIGAPPTHENVVNPWLSVVHENMETELNQPFLTFQYTIRKMHGSLGLTFGGGTETEPLHISSINPTGSAGVDGRLLVGDKILKIDGFDVLRASYDGAIALMRTTEDEVSFEISRVNPSYTSEVDSVHENENARNVHVQEPVGRLGKEELKRHQLLQTLGQQSQRKVEEVLNETIHDRMASPEPPREPPHLGSGFTSTSAVPVSQLQSTPRKGSGAIQSPTKSRQGEFAPTEPSNPMVQQLKDDAQESGTLSISEESDAFEFYQEGTPNNSMIIDEVDKPPSSRGSSGRRGPPSYHEIAQQRSETEADAHERSLLAMSTLIETDDLEVIPLSISKGTRGMGFTVVGVEDDSGSSIFVDRIAPSGPADKEGTLRAGDQILTVDGKPLVAITQDDAMRILRGTGPVVKLKVGRPRNEPLTGSQNNSPVASEGASDHQAVSQPPRSRHSQDVLQPRLLEVYRGHFPGTEILSLTVRKNGESLGMGIRAKPMSNGVSQPGIYVDHILPDGVIATANVLQTKDRILNVNGTDLSDVSRSFAVNVLKNASEPVNFIISRGGMVEPVEPVTHM